jgi:ubiquinol-cytochrome c reductase cytochrome c1 subunit
MKDLKILAILVVLVGILYYGVEPYAHHEMHPTLPPADFTFGGVKQVNTADANISEGQNIVATQCSTCHSVKAADINLSMSPADAAIAYGVVPPDLSNAGAIYDASYLAAFLQDPAKVSMAPKTGMPNLGLTEQQSADIVAYLKSISEHNLTGKQITEQACGYCHDIKYDKWVRSAVIGDLGVKRAKEYLGKNPPDLSLMIKSRGEHYLESFINDPQGVIHGTSMPRLGISQDAQGKIVEYLDQVGDPKKAERNSLGIWVLGYFVILTFFTYLWKTARMREVH